MKDGRIEARNEKMFKKPNYDFSRAREEFRLNIRKEKLENYFEQKRMKGYKDVMTDYPINMDSFNVSQEVKLKMESLYENDKVEYIYSLLNSSSIEEVKYSLAVYRDSLVKEKLYFNNKLFRKVCEKMLSSNPSDLAIINECLWCLINITFMNNDTFIFDVLTSPEIMQFYTMNINTIELKENMIILVSNLVGGDSKSRRVILSSELYEEIINIMKEENLFSIFKICMEFLIILFQFSSREELVELFLSKNERIFQTSLILRTLVTNGNDDTILCKTLECLVHFTHKFPIHNRHFLNKEFIDYLFTHLKHLKKNYSLKILGNLTSGNNLITFDLLKLDLINYLKELLSDDTFSYKKDVVWVISNIACATKNCLIQLITSDSLRDVKNCFYSGDDLVKKEVLHTFFNLSNFCDNDIANYLEHIGVFDIFKFFCEDGKSPVDIQMALIGIFNLLQLDDTNYFVYQMNKNGVYDKIVKLINHKNEMISKQVSAISYFFETLKEIN